MMQPPEPQRIAKAIEVSVLLKNGREEEFTVSSWSLSDGLLTLVLDTSTNGDLYQIMYPVEAFDRLDVHVVFEE